MLLLIDDDMAYFMLECFELIHQLLFRLDDYLTPFIVRLAPNGWKEMHRKEKNGTELSVGGETPDKRRQNSTWARLIKKVYGVDPLVCPKCGSEMKILSIVLDPEEIKKILAHLVKVGRSPPNFDPASLN